MRLVSGLELKKCELHIKMSRNSSKMFVRVALVPGL